jgi:hypothetical protein
MDQVSRSEEPTTKGTLSTIYFRQSSIYITVKVTDKAFALSAYKLSMQAVPGLACSTVLTRPNWP